MNNSIAVDVVNTHAHSRQTPSGKKTYDFNAIHVFADLAIGGEMIVHEMPNTTPPLTTYLEIKSRIEELRSIKNYGGLYFCYNGQNLEELKKCLADPEVCTYVVGVKIYPATKGEGSVTTSGGQAQDMYDFSLDDGSELDQIASFCSENKLSITIHCEDPVEKAELGERYGTFDDEAEPHFVENVAIPLCEKHPELKFIVAHISHKDTVAHLKSAWKKGMKNLYAEITPHHLLLTTQEIALFLEENAVFGFCHPFVKINARHRDTIQGLSVDEEFSEQILYGSDHAPHSEDAKRNKKFGGVPNHQGPQIVLAYFRARGFGMDHPIVQRFFSGNAQKVFRDVPGWMERFQQRTGSILFTPTEYEEGKSIPDRIHNGEVVNPWPKLIPGGVASHWVVPQAA